MADGTASGPFVVFADGFAGPIKEPGRALHRPTGLAIGPHGSLYISDDIGGRIWRVTYVGGHAATGIAPSAPTPPTEQVATSGSPLPPEGIHPVTGKTLPIPPGGSPDQVALGDRIFHGQAAGGTCAGCHGADGRGTAIGADLVAGNWLWSDGSVQGLMRVIRAGVPKA
jgi:mono/diheme cytochrome c family protein